MARKTIASCQCAKVKFESNAELIVHLSCHCTNCRLATGSDWSNIALFLEKSVQISGEVNSEHFKAGSVSDTMRDNCVNCGTVMFDMSARFAALIGVFSAQIETPSVDVPRLHGWTSSKLSSVEIPNSVKAFEKGLPAASN